MSDTLWYKNAIIYELHISAFFDGNADGIGDFRGLIEKLDYLQDLGITCFMWKSISLHTRERCRLNSSATRAFPQSALNFISSV